MEPWMPTFQLIPFCSLVKPILVQTLKIHCKCRPIPPPATNLFKPIYQGYQHIQFDTIVSEATK
ncbi:MAG: hypothetical protein DRQ62_15710 [Gammaproteobacteria bacterium]|nr:MAG: hypothetical protein DRQ62_15710 [Gammaproteobacteria bacterium]